jgi:hypothetical protein
MRLHDLDQQLIGKTKKLHIMAYLPELEADKSTSVSWDAEYIDANLYDVIQDARIKVSRTSHHSLL